MELCLNVEYRVTVATAKNSISWPKKTHKHIGKYRIFESVYILRFCGAPQSVNLLYRVYNIFGCIHACMNGKWLHWNAIGKTIIIEPEKLYERLKEYKYGKIHPTLIHNTPNTLTYADRRSHVDIHIYCVIPWTNMYTIFNVEQTNRCLSSSFSEWEKKMNESTYEVWLNEEHIRSEKDIYFVVCETSHRLLLMYDNPNWNTNVIWALESINENISLSLSYLHHMKGDILIYVFFAYICCLKYNYYRKLIFNTIMPTNWQTTLKTYRLEYAKSINNAEIERNIFEIDNQLLIEERAEKIIEEILVRSKSNLSQLYFRSEYVTK